MTSAGSLFQFSTLHTDLAADGFVYET